MLTFLLLSSVYLLKVDGFLARRYNMGSVAGTVLDPLVRRVLASCPVSARSPRTDVSSRVFPSVFRVRRQTKSS